MEIDFVGPKSPIAPPKARIGGWVVRLPRARPRFATDRSLLIAGPPTRGRSLADPRGMATPTITSELATRALVPVADPVFTVAGRAPTALPNPTVGHRAERRATGTRVAQARQPRPDDRRRPTRERRRRTRGHPGGGDRCHRLRHRVHTVDSRRGAAILRQHRSGRAPRTAEPDRKGDRDTQEALTRIGPSAIPWRAE